MKSYPNGQLLVTAGQLAKEVEARQPLLILDLRPPEAYTAGHVPGAIHIDLWGVSLIDTDPAPLKAFMWMIEHVLAVHGVTAETPVVVYDEQSGVRAARAFWFLEYFGHPSVRLLDGGFGAWTSAGLPVTRESAPPPKSEWTGSREERTIATWREVRDAIGSSDAVILDARTDGEYLRNDRARETRRRRAWCDPHRLDAEPRSRRRVQAGGGAPRDVRVGRRHAGPGGPDLLPGRLPRRERVSRAALAGIPARPQLRRLLEGMGGQRGASG